jgi:hypothetical protein
VGVDECVNRVPSQYDSTFRALAKTYARVP